MLNNKKGQGGLLEDVKYIILALIVLFALVSVILMILLPSGAIASDWACKTSVAWASGSFAIANKLGFDSIMCYTEDVKSEAKKKDEALDEVAERMRKCWNMWGEGNLNPEGKNIWYGGEEKCFTCYKLSFPELEESISITDISAYLQKGREHNKLKGADSYWNYFKSSNPANIIGVTFPNTENENNIIKKDKYYAVVYSENVEKSTIGHLLKGAGVGFVTGAAYCAFTGGGALICGAFGATIGLVGKTTEFGLEDVWNALWHKSPADGIMFMDYNDSKNKCVTVVRAGEEVKMEEAIKNE